MSESICPVCKKLIRFQSWYDSDVHMTVETHEECKACGYEQSWAYGATVLAVAKYRSGYYHTDSFKAQRKVMKRFKRNLRKARRAMIREHRRHSLMAGIPQ